MLLASWRGSSATSVASRSPARRHSGTPRPPRRGKDECVNEWCVGSGSCLLWDQNTAFFVAARARQRGHRDASTKTKQGKQEIESHPSLTILTTHRFHSYPTSMERRPSSWLRQGRRAAAALLLLGCVASPPTAWAYLGPAAGSSSASARSASSSSQVGAGTCGGGRQGWENVPGRGGVFIGLRRRGRAL